MLCTASPSLGVTLHTDTHTDTHSYINRYEQNDNKSSNLGVYYWSKLPKMDEIFISRWKKFTDFSQNNCNAAILLICKLKLRFELQTVALKFVQFANIG